MAVGFQPSPCVRIVTESLASLYTGAESNPRDRVLGEVEKDSFIALPGKRGHTGLLPRKTMCPNTRGFDDGFITVVQGMVSDKIRVFVGLV